MVADSAPDPVFFFFITFYFLLLLRILRIIKNNNYLQLILFIFTSAHNQLKITHSANRNNDYE